MNVNYLIHYNYRQKGVYTHTDPRLYASFSRDFFASDAWRSRCRRNWTIKSVIDLTISVLPSFSVWVRIAWKYAHTGNNNRGKSVRCKRRDREKKWSLSLTNLNLFGMIRPEHWALLWPHRAHRENAIFNVSFPAYLPIDLYRSRDLGLFFCSITNYPFATVQLSNARGTY